jgi:hypothetical protein
MRLLRRAERSQANPRLEPTHHNLTHAATRGSSAERWAAPRG